VNRWAFISEQFVHGNPSGLDNNICTFGGAILFQKNNPLQRIKCSAVRVLLVSTDIPRSTKALVAKVIILLGSWITFQINEFFYWKSAMRIF